MKKYLVYFSLFIYVISFSQELSKDPTDISPLLIGERLPEIVLQTVENKSVELNDLLFKKKSILVFYRGGWCPYCNTHLSALAEIEGDLLKLGYQIIAISPDSPSSLRITSSKEKLNYTLLSDSKSIAAKAFGIAFTAPDNYSTYLTKGSDGINTSFLPVPSLFIFDGDEIVFEYISPNFKQRISKELLLVVSQNFAK